MRAVVWRLSSWAVRTLGVMALLTAQPPSCLMAQVGHDPFNSPYRDIPLHPALFVFGGHLSHDRGRTGAGPSNASTFGARYEMPAGHSMGFQFTLAYLRGDRFILDPRVDSTSPYRKQVPFPTDLGLAEIALQVGPKIALAGPPADGCSATLHLVVTADVRAHLWRLKYPFSFHGPAPDNSQ